jgi:ABC-type multidrug transport system fused ATPase/permease subunit
MQALESRSPNLLLSAFLVFGALFLGDLVFRFLRNYLLRAAGERCLARLREQAFEAMVALPSSFYDTHPAGTLSSRFLFDAAAIPSAVEGLGYYVTSPLSLIGLLVVAFYQDWKLTCIALIAAPGLAWLFKLVGASVKRNTMRTNSAMGDMNTTLHELAQGMKVIKIFRGEGNMVARFQSRNRAALKSTLKMVYVQELMSPFSELIMGLVAAGVLVYLGMKVIHGQLSLGDMAQEVTAFGLLQEPIRRMNGIHARVIQGLTSCERIFEFMDAPKEEQQVTQQAAALVPVPVPTHDVTISFDNVTFAYNERAPVLQNVSFTIQAGEWVGVQGPSGTGKSTIAHLIAGLYPLTDGNILINGRAIDDMPLAQLRALISIVSQDVFLFHDTVFQNVLMGRPNARSEEVWQAIRAAHADEFVRALPQREQTVLGDRGCTLSGGQRQRLSIARAFLKNAPVLILDEATSALDSISEQEVQRALADLMKGRTVLMIGHQRSALRQAHRIIELKHGSIYDAVKDSTETQLGS